MVISDQLAQRCFVQTIKDMDQLCRALFIWSKAGIETPKRRYHRIAVLLGDRAVFIAMAAIDFGLVHVISLKNTATPESSARSNTCAPAAMFLFCSCD
jgi:hypothetical protein